MCCDEGKNARYLTILQTGREEVEKHEKKSEIKRKKQQRLNTVLCDEEKKCTISYSITKWRKT